MSITAIFSLVLGTMVFAPAPETAPPEVSDPPREDPAPPSEAPMTPVPFTEDDRPAGEGPAARPPAPAPTPPEPSVDAQGHAVPPTPQPPATDGGAEDPPHQKRPGRPIRWRLNFLGGASSTTIFNSSYLGFDEDRTLWAGGVGARFDVPIARGRVFLGGGLRWRRSRTSRGPILGGFDTELRIDEPELNGRVSVVAIEGLDVFADLGAGPSVRRYELESSSESPNGRHIGWTGAAVAGASVYLPKRWLPRKKAARITPGFELSLGYRHRSPAPITVNVEDDDDPISVRSTSFGDVKASGLQFGVSLFLRVM